MMIMMLVVTIMSCIMLVMMIDIERKRYEVKIYTPWQIRTHALKTTDYHRIYGQKYIGCRYMYIMANIYMANTQTREVRAHNNWRMLSATSNIWASQPLTTLQMISSLQTLTQDLYPVVKSVPSNAPNYLQAFPGHQTC